MKPLILLIEERCKFIGNMLSLVLSHLRWRWLGQMKQRSGGFSMAQGGEVDIRYVFKPLKSNNLLTLSLTAVHTVV
jgi:hypothetical protein